MLGASKTERFPRIAFGLGGKTYPIMRKLILTLIAFAALVGTGHANAATTTTVNIYGSTFSPKSVTITAGDTIKWVNRDNANHQIYGSGGRFISPILKHGQSWSFTFNAAGSYTYKDELHPKLTGTIGVKGAPPTLTLESSVTYSTFGSDATISGIVSNHQPGEQVTIFYQPYGTPNLMERTVVLTDDRRRVQLHRLAADPDDVRGDAGRARTRRRSRSRCSRSSRSAATAAGSCTRRAVTDSPAAPCSSSG